MGATFIATLKAALRDPGVLLLALVAPVLYAFFYPLPYLHQNVTRVPVALVDQDGSSLARQLVRYAGASPKLDLRFVTGSEAEARAAMQRREIEGYAVLPPDLKRSVVRGSAVVVPVVGDGAYFLLNKTVLAGFAESIGTVSAGIEIRRLLARGQSTPQASASRSPVTLQTVALFNPSEGYGSYVVPAVAVLIVHQTLLMAVALAVGTRFEGRPPAERVPEALGRMGAYALLGLVNGAWFFGFVFWLFDYGRGGNPAGAALQLALMTWTASALGCALGAWWADRERAMQVLLFTSIPMVFLSGFSWPQEALAPPLRALAGVLPTTPAIQGMLRFNQMGASLAEAAPQLQQAALLAAGATALALLALGRRFSPQPAPPSLPAGR